MKKIKISQHALLVAVVCMALVPSIVKAQDQVQGSQQVQTQDYEEEFLAFRKKIQLSVSNDEPVELDLKEILAKAIENNINLQIAKANTKEAQWKFWGRISDALPDMRMSASTIQRNGTFYLTNTLQSPIDQRTSNAALRFTYRVFDGGSTTFLAWAEKFYKNATESKEKSQYNKVLYDSVDFYYQLVKAQATLVSRTKSLESAQFNRNLAKQFYEAGTGTKFDLIQAEARLARTEQDLIEAEAQFRATGFNLANHLNSPLESGFAVDKEHVAKLDMIDDNLTVQNFLEQSLKNNPDIKAALEARKGAYKEGFSKAGDYLPKVDIYANFGGSGQQFDNLFGLTTLGLEANYNIGDGLGLTAVANTMQAKARANRAKLEYQRELLRIETALRMSYLDFQKTKSKVKVAEKEYDASAEALRLAKLRYENGIEIFTNLIQREADLTAAEINLINSTADYNLTQAKLAYNMGTISVGTLVGIQEAESPKLKAESIIKDTHKGG